MTDDVRQWVADGEYQDSHTVDVVVGWQVEERGQRDSQRKESLAPTAPCNPVDGPEQRDAHRNQHPGDEKERQPCDLFAGEPEGSQHRDYATQKVQTGPRDFGRDTEQAKSDLPEEKQDRICRSGSEQAHDIRSLNSV